MKKILTSAFFGFLFVLYPSDTFANEQSIQERIHQANPGDTIELADGTYDEPIVINKPLRIVGNRNVTFIVHHAKPIVTIESDHVTMEQIHFIYTNEHSDMPAIFVKGNNNFLSNLHIQTNSYGIRLDNAHYNSLANITILGDHTMPIRERKHGIDLWESNGNEIFDSQVTNVQDGLYLESSDENHIYRNLVTNSRYGYHLMFTNDTVLENNESYENISGMMIMGTNATRASHNILKFNQKNVQSLGLLLFDVVDATITNNEISNNRIGIFVEDASNNDISNNNIQNNFIGIQFKHAKNNTIFHNSFIANVVQGQAEESSNNDTNQNYWGDHLGLDFEGDQKSNLVYEVNPFYLNLTNEYPPYRLLFQSPGMIFLEQLLHTPIEQRFIDHAPLMKSPIQLADTNTHKQLGVLLFSLTLLIISTFTMIMGVKKQ